MRILYHAVDRRGSGQLTRLSAIALAVQEQAPDVHQLMATSATYPPLLKRLRMPSMVLPGDDGVPLAEANRRRTTVSTKLARRIFTETVRAYDPKVVVFDTLAPRGIAEEAWRDGRQLVLVLPHCREEALAGLARGGLLARFGLVLLPYTREQPAASAPDSVAEQLDRLAVARYVGGIVFPSLLDPAGIGTLAARYGIAEAERLILVCAGSAGYSANTRRFIATACRAAIERRRLDPSVRVLCVAGANADLIPTLPGCTVIDFEPDLPLLMARAELVVGQAEYNTVQEVLRAGTRALLIPAPSGETDEAALLRVLLPRPGMRALPPDASVPAIGRALHHLLQEPRPQPAAAGGAAVAARAILGLGDLPDIYLCSRAPSAAAARGRRAGPRQLVRSLRANEAEARLRIDWDVVANVLDGLGPEPRARIISIEVHLGADAEDWEWRTRRVHNAVLASGFDPQALTLCLDDASGGWELAALAERIGELRFRSLVAQVPLALLRARPGDVFEAAERCRALPLEFGVDITVLEDPLPFIDQA
jgi:hypothetical protein